jgi:hypothetical protein
MMLKGEEDLLTGYRIRAGSIAAIGNKLDPAR